MLERLIHQMKWANDLTLEWLAGDRKEKDAHLHLAAHILNAESVWIQRVRGVLRDKTAFTPRSLDEMVAMNAANHRDLVEIAGGDVSRPFDYALFSGEPGRSTVLQAHGRNLDGKRQVSADMLQSSRSPLVMIPSPSTTSPAP